MSAQHTHAPSNLCASSLFAGCMSRPPNDVSACAKFIFVILTSLAVNLY